MTHRVLTLPSSSPSSPAWGCVPSWPPATPPQRPASSPTPWAWKARSARPGHCPPTVRPEDYAVFAGIFPEGKYDLVKSFQGSGHTVGMCGDGANDAPALRQAQMGIAVSTATDVAKSAAGIVLTTAGLSGIVAGVREGRLTYQRILTYTLNSFTKKITNVLFITLGLVITGHAVLTPMLMVIIMITGDFLGMSVTTDNVRPSSTPSVWQIAKLTKAGVAMGLCFLAFCTGSLLIGKFSLGLGTAAAANPLRRYPHFRW